MKRYPELIKQVGLALEDLDLLENSRIESDQAAHNASEQEISLAIRFAKKKAIHWARIFKFVYGRDPNQVEIKDF